MARSIHPLVPGDRVRHVAQQYTTKATASVIKVETGALNTWEYSVRLDRGPGSIAWGGRWNSEATVFVEHQRCPDDGRCWHECGDTSCFRVVTCSPLGRDSWTEEERQANPPERLRASIEAVIVSGE
jgi:hypothetical protein